ncbi:NAD_binding_10 domain-containing protein [Cephalotus follicularis]|uniref:NAD_binding_10 domain-containing protein n=1 Tax=Cephalotus follicularis TaxID=3775 RepID=A0A1Q3AWF1_CEPFO|nr:NAD_binding_10 domain-containing protein [Cephalotus follicularis]
MAIMPRLLHSQSSFYKPHRLATSMSGRSLSTGQERVDKSSKIEEAETVKVTPPLTDKLLVLGGNGFVGSHICKEALNCGLTVSSLSRSGRSTIPDSWANDVVWHQGDLLSPDSLRDALNGVTSVISCVGGFGSNSHMYRINGIANMNAIGAAAEQGVKRFVYISAADFGLVNYLLKGYYEGKRATETELMNKFPYKGVVLRPGFIQGTRLVGSIKIPLSVIGAPLEMVLQYLKPLTRIPLIGPLFISPVNVTAVAKVAVNAATDPAFPPGVVDVDGILQYSRQKAA